MTRYADPLVCPDCRDAIEYGVATCPHCELPLRGTTAQSLFATLVRADQLIAELRRPVPTIATGGLRPLAVGAVPSGGSARSLLDEPTAAAPRPSRLDAASIPKILLGLGATCLLAAALVFLVVAWSSMGMGGRTAVLLTLTSLAGAAMVWLAGRSLRAGAESFGVVMLGLLALDVTGAENAGWLGDHSSGGFALILGGVVAVAAFGTARFGLGSRVERLIGAEVIAALSSAMVGAAMVDVLPDAAGMLAATLVTVTAAGLALRSRLRDLGIGLGAIAGLWWLGLVAIGFDDVLADPTADRIWGEFRSWPLVTAAALAAVPAGVRRLGPVVRVAAAAVAATVLTAAATVVVVGNPLTQVAETGLAVLVLASAAAWLLPSPWRWAPLGPLAPAAVATVFFAVLQAGFAVSRLGLEFWSAAPGQHVLDLALPLAPWLLVPLVAGLALAVFVGAALVEERLPWALVLSPVVALTVAATLASYDVPLWLPFSVLVVGALATFTAEVLSGSRIHAGAAIVGAAALGAGLPSDWLTLGALLTLTALALGVDAIEDDALAARFALPVLIGASIATMGELASWTTDWRAVTVIAAVGLLALWRPDPAVEVAAGLTGAFAVVAQQPTLTWLAVDLTVAGALVTASALLHRRSDLGWAGSALLMAATWVRLADLDVTAVEAYTLPLAAALVVIGLWRMWRSDAPSLQALAHGLVLAVSPTLLQVLAEPVSDRAVLLGAGCLALVLAGVWLHWSGPFLIGAAGGGLEVLREASYASVLPQWVLIALVGGLLTVIGVTWEQRLRDLRLAAGYVRGLR